MEYAEFLKLLIDAGFRIQVCELGCRGGDRVLGIVADNRIKAIVKIIETAYNSEVDLNTLFPILKTAKRLDYTQYIYFPNFKEDLYIN